MDYRPKGTSPGNPENLACCISGFGMGMEALTTRLTSESTLNIQDRAEKQCKQEFDHGARDSETFCTTGMCPTPTEYGMRYLGCYNLGFSLIMKSQECSSCEMSAKVRGFFQHFQSVTNRSAKGFSEPIYRAEKYKPVKEVGDDTYDVLEAK